MGKINKLFILLLVFFALSLIVLFPKFSQAGPALREYIINNETKQCASFSAGDECQRCVIPQGWQRLGYYSEADCPEDYIMIEPEIQCRPVWKLFCIIPGHSGSNFTQYYFWHKLVPTIVVIILIVFLIFILKKKGNYNK